MTHIPIAQPIAENLSDIRHSKPAGCSLAPMLSRGAPLSPYRVFSGSSAAAAVFAWDGGARILPSGPRSIPPSRNGRHCVAAIDVAIDARVTSHMSAGMVQYVRELIARLPRVANDLRFTTFGAGDNFDVAEQIAMPLQILRMRPRLVHFPSPYAPLAVPAPYVVTIHDLIDLHYPQWTKPRARLYYRHAVRRTARGARCVITDDPATARDLRFFYGIAAERIAVIPLGVDVGDVQSVRREVPYAIYA